MPKEKRLSRRSGVTLIEVLLDATILAIISTVVIIALLASIRTVSKSSTIASAGQLANEKIEYLRNLSYNSLATVDGAIFPPGTLPDSETITKSGRTFVVLTNIQYADDPYDGTAGGNPNDPNPADYKKITVEVRDTNTSTTLAKLSTDIASKAAETDSNTGVLKITVLDASGVPVANASLSIFNSGIIPAVDMAIDTDANGGVVIPNLPTIAGYHVSVSKGGYSADSTHPISQTNPFPTNPDATIIFQQVTPVTLAIDHTATLIIAPQGIPPGQSITATITGQKLIGTNPDIPKTSFTSSLGGDPVTIANVEYDSYTISTPTGWYITTCDPMMPAPLAPNGSTTITCFFTTDASAPRITSLGPRQLTAATAIDVVIRGANLDAASFTIQRGSDPEITISNGLSVAPTFDELNGTTNDFNGVPAGTYNLIYRNNNGFMITQLNAIIVQ